MLKQWTVVPRKGTRNFQIVRTGVLCFMGAFFLSPVMSRAFAQSEATEEPAAVEASAGEDALTTETSFSSENVQSQEGASSEIQSGQGEGNVSLDFHDAEIRNVLQILAFKSGMNIVVSPEVTGVVTIQLNDVPWKQALEVILQIYGYAFEQKGSIILVMTVDNLKKRREDALLLAEQEPLVTETFTINFGKASEIIQSIEKMKSDRGNINFDERTNMLIVTDTETKLALIAGVVGKLDTTTPLVRIEAKIVETSFSDEENLGIDWTMEAAVSGSQRPHTWPFAKTTSSKFAPDPFPAATSGFAYGTLDFSQLQALFEALKSKSDTDILSSPNIVTMDNKPAKIVVGSQYPIPSYTYNEDQARLQISGWEYKDIGVIFDVTPHVNSAGFVTLDIEPRITAILDFVTVENTSLPRLSNETTKTSVMIKGGETLVIGGLVKKQLTDTKRKVPFLSDIPAVGLIFQKSEKELTKTDLLIFMTPHIITPEIPKEE